MVKNGDAVYFYYNEDGVRLQKTATGTTGVTKYSLHGKNIVHLTNAKNNLHFFYDARNKPAVVTFNGTAYAYLYNLQGDVIALIDSNGKKVVEYKYDAWGRILSKTGTMASTLGTLNPFRYRGYVYDEETGLYYVSSRYYNPETSRFINTDDIDLLGINDDCASLNLFAYCGNNPVSREDANGGFWLTVGIMAIGGLIGAAISAISSVVTQQAQTGTVNWKSVGVATASGFASGAIAASPLGLTGQMVAGGVIGGLSYAADCYVNDEAIAMDDAVLSVGLGVFSGWLGGSGANEKMVLNNVVKGANKTIVREMRRANRKYAQKAIAATIRARNNTFAITAWDAGVKFAAGTEISNAINGQYSNCDRFPHAPTWKAW